MNASAQINQLLGTHAIQAIYQGNPVLTPNGSGGTAWQYHLDSYDVAQPFTMSGTTVGRVAIPMLPVGNGADLIVSLCNNSSGVPGSVITQTRIPANWITQLSAVSGAGPSSLLPTTQLTGNPLATASFNTLRTGASWTSTPYTLAAGGAGGAALPAVAVSGSYFIFAGGEIGTQVTNVVTTIQWAGDGVLNAPVLQPALPQATTAGAVAATSDTVVFAGGWNGGTSAFSNVWCASWNPSSGAIGAWSGQTALPQGLIPGAMATWGETVYVIAGQNNVVTGALTNVVYYATLSNGQIGAWNTGPSYPVALQNLYAFTTNGFLVVAGGENSSFASVANVYYAKINSDGSLGPWQTGPSLPVAANTDPAGANLAVTSFGGVVLGGFISGVGLESLTVEASGLGMWQTQNPSVFGVASGNNPVGAFPSGNGVWELFSIDPGLGAYLASTLNLVPSISVPLPATGLTNGSTYHILLSQPAGDLNDYVRVMDDLNVYSGSPTALFRSKGSSMWAAGTSGHAVPITIYDKSVLGKVWHLWEDSGARIVTPVWATTPNQPLLGLLEATSQPGPPLNMNYTFTQGVAPWHPTGGTFVQSSAQTHGALPVSALLTPSGSASLSYAESELVAAHPGHTFVLTAWYYSPTGYSNVAISVNWFNSAGSYISTTSGTATSIPANTWTQFQTTVTNNIANATQLDMVCIEGGTPPATALLYVSAATVQDTSGPQVSSVLGYNYNGTWPNPGMWPPTGVTLLA